MCIRDRAQPGPRAIGPHLRIRFGSVVVNPLNPWRPEITSQWSQMGLSFSGQAPGAPGGGLELGEVQLPDLVRAGRRRRERRPAVGRELAAFAPVSYTHLTP